MVRIVFGLIFAALAGLAVWWFSATALSQPTGPAADLSAPTAVNHSALFVDERNPSASGRPSQAFFDPLEIGPCNLTPILEQDVSSQVDGIFDEVIVDVGRQVQKGDLLGRLDDRQLKAQVDLLAIRAASEAAEGIAKAQFDEANAKVEYARKANGTGLRTVPELEASTYLFQRERYAFEIKKAREERETAQKELEKTRVVLQQHEIRAGLAGEIVKVYKRPGEAVKQAEPLFRVAQFNSLRVEGLCKIQQANLVRVGMRTLVEPEIRGEQMTQLVGHTGAITALAASADGRLLASASEDRSVLLWNWPQGTRHAELSHSAEVSAVAFLRSNNQGCSLLTGCGDGQVQRWQVPASAAANGKPISVKMAEQHEGPVRTIAVNADASRFATGGEDKRIGIWDVDTGKHLFWLVAEEGLSAHQGAVTSLRFCPDGQLVSAGRDQTVKIWKLSDSGGSLIRAYSGRTCEVSQLGVSPEGKRVLLDLGEELRIVDREGGNCLGSLHSRRQGRFQALAEFSPSGRLILTASSNMRLQLWSVPPTTEETEFFRQGYVRGFHRSSLLTLTDDPLSLLSLAAAAEKTPRLWNLSGSEVRHFVIPGASNIQAGRFSPDESVFFTGGYDKVIRVWAVPSTAQWQQPYEARITYVGNQIERGTDMVRIRAELENPSDAGRRLRAGMFATLRIFPETVNLK